MAQQITVEYDRLAHFLMYKTFAILEGQIRSTDPKLDAALVRKKLPEILRERLKGEGLTEAADHPAILVRYALGPRDTSEIPYFPQGWRRQGGKFRKTTNGTLIVDLRDATTRQLVWRATCLDTASEPETMEQRLESDVKKMFEKYPPKR